MGDSREPCRPSSRPSWQPRTRRRTRRSSARRRHPAVRTIRTASSSPTRRCARRCSASGSATRRPATATAIGSPCSSRTGPEFFFHYLALNALGCGVVPVNPDYRHDELAYQIDHSEAALAVSVPARVADLEAAAASATEPLPVVDASALPAALPRPGPAPRARRARARHRVRPALHLGHHRPAQGLRADQPLLPERRRLVPRTWAARLAIEPGRERFLNPLPLFHMNCQAVTATCAILTANCLDPARALQPAPLVAGRGGHAGHDDPLPRRDAAAPAQPAAGRPRSPRTGSSSGSARASSPSFTQRSRSASASPWSRSGA